MRARWLGLTEGEDALLLPVAAGLGFLAALALASAWVTAALAGGWQGQAARQVVVVLPDGARAGPVLEALKATDPGARRLGQEELAGLLRPWLGASPGALLGGEPAVFLLEADAAAADRLAASLPAMAPGAVVERAAEAAAALRRLALGVTLAGGMAVAVVAAVAALLVALATRAELAGRRTTLEILHALGATDGQIAGRLARRSAGRAAAGALLGMMAAGAVATPLAALAAHLAPVPAMGGPGPELLAGVLAIPVVATLLGWGASQLAVRRWLGRLP